MVDQKLFSIKKTMRYYPNHNIQRHVRVHIFYHGLTESECHNLLNNLVANHSNKKSEKVATKKVAGVLKLDQVQHVPVVCKEYGKGHHSYQCPHSKFLQVLKKLYINIPFAEALKHMPSYVKFTKDILSKKRHLDNCVMITLTKECSTIIQKKLSSKLEDPGSFMIPCEIGIYFWGKALYRSFSYPRGIIDNVLVKVDKFIFPADFLILDMETDSQIPIIVKRPFLTIGRTLIDVQKGE
ncbi:hypothetical protein CDL12_04819 [Handroanthus impetiginosus]|uniref:Uncharacterized protein n=1 Tax=Handroanthus impetiginosus TaxID=429701 RepID=A0A2G9HY81_9LAMI|nr:hypothetical protein CDL12_04819 [Handroanthus impetiginosus]